MHRERSNVGQALLLDGDSCPMFSVDGNLSDAEEEDEERL